MAKLIEWEERFDVANEEINMQHRKLFETVNTFLMTALEGEDKKAIEEAIDAMIDYVDIHFRFEEKCLAAHPEISSHRKMHWEFSKKTMELARKIQHKPDEQTLLEINNFLVDWLENHITGTDKRMFSELDNS